MALRRYAKQVDGTIPVQALLYDDEELQSTQDNVGIYDGSQKSPNHQQGTVHLTGHRLFYIDAAKPESYSFYIDLAYIGKTDYYGGLFKSSPKATCYLSGQSTGSISATSSTDSGSAHVPSESWECEVCAYRNPPGLSPAAASICGLCGVPRTAVPRPTALDNSQKVPQKQHLSTSLPPSASSTPAPGAWNTEPQPLTSSKQEIACPACTFLNHPSMLQCELCSTDLPRSKPQLKSAPTSRSLTPGSGDEDDGSTAKVIKVSFRKGGDKPFYNLLKRSLKAKAWEGTTSRRSLHRNTNSSDLDNPNSLGMTGISGILRTVKNTQDGTQTAMKDSLQDLEALMVKAKDMVKLAAELNEKLTAVTSAQAAAASSTAAAYSSTSTLATSEPEEATFIRSSLSQLGLQMSNTPVTLDMMKDEHRWYVELARELARVLQGGGNTASPSIRDRDRDATGGGLMKERGIIALDEVWGGWNRARGVALIPPSTFLQVLPLLPSHTSPPIKHRAFPSGLNVLHTPPYTSKAFSSRLLSLLQVQITPAEPAYHGLKSFTYTPLTITEIADEENLPVGLVGEMVYAVEEEMATICRDDEEGTLSGSVGMGTGVYAGGTSADTMWWPNVFVGYTWDGQD